MSYLTGSSNLQHERLASRAGSGPADRVLAPRPLVVVECQRRALAYGIAKRGIDVFGALALLALAGPVMLAVALAVKLTSTGPVLYRQDRLGRSGRTFRILKFRTMVPGADAALLTGETYACYLATGYKLPRGQDTRLTSIGGWLRRSSIDELPQLFNVLAGQMSLVGPRPVVPDEIGLYGELQHCYLDVRPGLTGLWQVSGRSLVGYPERCHIDRDYFERRSVRTDLSILLKTPVVVLKSVGAH